MSFLTGKPGQNSKESRKRMIENKIVYQLTNNPGYAVKSIIVSSHSKVVLFY
jgi:hypothetical protein